MVFHQPLSLCWTRRRKMSLMVLGCATNPYASRAAVAIRHVFRTRTIATCGVCKKNTNSDSRAREAVALATLATPALRWVHRCLLLVNNVKFRRNSHCDRPVFPFRASYENCFKRHHKEPRRLGTIARNRHVTTDEAAKGVASASGSKICKILSSKSTVVSQW